MKISIKASIIFLFTLILVVIGSTLIFLDYLTSHNILLTSAENLIKGSGIYIEQHINNFILPVASRVKVSANLIKTNIIQPGDSKQFYAFLQENIVDLPRFSGAFWSDQKDTVYLLERSAKNTFYKEKIITTSHGNFVTSEEIDQHGKTITPAITLPTDYNTKTRTWYTEAQAAKNCRISNVYTFYPFGTNKPILGSTYVCPLYNDLQQFIGMFAIDVHVATLDEFVDKIKITPNTDIIIFDRSRNVIAYNKGNYSPQDSLLKIEQLKLPWVEDLLQQERVTHKTTFIYKYQGKQYLAYYKPLAITSENNWYIGIVIPLRDVEAGLNARLMLSSAIAASILIIGIFLAWLAGHTLSRPIIKLADETGLIKQLDLSFESKLKSYVKEIAYMQDAFNSMKKSLQSFARYVPITLVKRLISSGAVAQVGGENKVVTFMFSDISGFTSISENMDPTDLLNYLSEYFKTMSKIILHNKGTIDKYIGDAIMAFWNAPMEDTAHAYNSCQSALEMLQALTLFNATWRTKGKTELAVRIGINTGNAIIGNVGSEDRLSYSAIGDSVNLTNRIEELNKIYKTTIIVSHSTYSIVKDSFTFRLIDNVIVRGRHEGVLIYELLPANHMFGDNLATYNTQFQTAFNLYQQKRWEEAQKLFTQIVTSYPQDTLSCIFMERCNYLIKNPPTDWNGVWRFQ